MAFNDCAVHQIWRLVQTGDKKWRPRPGNRPYAATRHLEPSLSHFRLDVNRSLSSAAFFNSRHFILGSDTPASNCRFTILGRYLLFFRFTLR